MLATILLIAIFLLYVYVRKRLSYWSERNVPNLHPLTPLGDLLYCVRERKSVYELVSHVYHRFKAEGHRYAGFYFTLGPVFLPIDIDLIKRIAATDHDHFHDRDVHASATDAPLSGTVFTCKPSRWKYLREKINGHLVPNKLKLMEPIVDHYVGECCDRIGRNLNATVDVYDTFFRYTLDVACNVYLGLDERCLNDREPPVFDYIRRLHTVRLNQLLRVYLRYGTTKMTNIMIALLWDDELYGFLRGYAKSAYDLRKSGRVRRDDVLSELIELHERDGESFDFDAFVCQVFILVAGTVETTAITASNLLYEIAKCEGRQARLRAEIEAMYARNAAISFETVGELAFLDSMLLETLRYHPVFGFLTRACTKAYRVPDSELVIEEGTSVLIPTMTVHYDEDVYERAHEFCAERFMVDNKAKQNFIAFGLGPKHCPGKRLATLMIKSLVVALLKDYEVRLDPTMPLKLTPTKSMEHILFKYKETILLKFDKKPLDLRARK